MPYVFRTDLFMYIVNGETGTLLTDFHELDRAYSVDERIATGVIGITVKFYLINCFVVIIFL